MKEFVPHDYQKYCIQKVVELPNVALFLDMGLGKTVITLSALAELKYNRWQIRKTLVIAPKKVAEATWTSETAAWSHLRLLKVVTVLGSAQERTAALEQDADVYVTNRDNVIWLVEHYGHDWPFDCVVLDESSSFKNPQAKRFKALKAVRPRISRMIELTGTPAPQGLMDIWAQILLLDGGERLGRYISRYREEYFLPDKRNQVQVWSWKLKPGAAEQIQRRISDICVSMSASDWLQMPDVVTDNVYVKLDPKAAEAYRTLERDMLLQVTPEDLVSAGSAGVLTGKLLQLCNGAVYDEEHRVQEIHDCKIEAFLEMVEQLHGQHALVFYAFKHDLVRLLQALEGKGLRVRAYTGAQDEVDWNAGRIDILLAHPASCAYGLNLQKGGYHTIWFGLTWSLEQYQQANKRLHRQGQRHTVIVHHLIVKGGMDEDVLKALEGKEGVQDSLLTSLKARIEDVKKGAGE